MSFPEGDTLGVVLSFLTSCQLLRGSLFSVSKEWNRVLCELPHAWGEKLKLYWANNHNFRSRFAWSHITHLEMTRCCERELENISSMPLLRRIDLSHCEVTDMNLAHFSSLSQLQDLDLTDCHKITDDGLAHLSSLPLQHLGLCNCKFATDVGLAHLKRCPLQSLDLCGCYHVTDIGLRRHSLIYVCQTVPKSQMLAWCILLHYH